MNTVDSLLTRLQLETYIPNFRNAKVERVQELRLLTTPELQKYVHDEADRKRLQDALSGLCGAPVPGSAEQQPVNIPASNNRRTDRFENPRDGNNYQHGNGRGNNGFRGDHDTQRGGYRGNNQREGGYRGNNQREGGYRGDNQREGGYRGDNQREGGYRGDNQREGGYRGNNQREGGYRGDNQREGGYRGDNQREGGYRVDNQREGGYRGNNQREGGYRGDNQREGGYRGDNNQREGGYRGDNQREGGYRGNNQREGGYRGDNQREGGYRGDNQREGGYRGDIHDNQREGGYRGRGRTHGICSHFNSSTGCRNGENCELKHVHDENLDGVKRPNGICRDYRTPDGCSYGADCKYRHTDEAYNGPEGIQERPFEPAPGGYEVTIPVPQDRVRLLLASNAKTLREIHARYKTNNPRVQKPEEYQATINFTIYGTKEGVENAKRDIEHIVGIQKRRDEELRFQYYIKEHAFNIRCMEILATANLKKKDTHEEVPEVLLQRISKCLKLKDPIQGVRQYFVMMEGFDRTRLKFLGTILTAMQGNVQAIVFCFPKTIDKMIELLTNQKDTLRYFGGATPVFLRPPGFDTENLENKIARMGHMKKFKDGFVLETKRGNMVQRLLICTDDYARYARRHAVPFVNMVIHYNFPRSKESYAYRQLLLADTNGCSFLFTTERESDRLRQITDVVNVIQVNDTELNEHMASIVDEFDYETKENVITDYAKVEPTSEKWEEEITEKNKLREELKSSQITRDRVVSEIAPLDG